MTSVGPLKSYGGDDESGNHHLTCSSVTGPNLVSRGRSNLELPRGANFAPPYPDGAWLKWRLTKG